MRRREPTSSSRPPDSETSRGCGRFIEAQKLHSAWDVLQCALVDVLLADGVLTERAAFVARCQRATLQTLEDLVARARARASCSENPFALTVPVVPESQALSGLSGVKLYPELQAMRLDVSRTMVERVRDVTRT